MPLRLTFVAVLAVSALGPTACSSSSNALDRQPSTTSAVTPASAPKDDSAFVYTAARGDSTLTVARKFLSRTSLMTVAEMETAIRTANQLRGSSLKPGQPLTIPHLETQPVVEKSRPVPKDVEIRAIYLTGAMAGSERGIHLIRRWRQAGGNAVVFDIKDSDGSLSIPFDHPLVSARKNYSISNLPKFIRFLHSLDMYGIARIALFRDERVAQNFPHLAVQSRGAGGAWRENGKLAWVDPSHPEVQAYNLALAKYVAGSGADEVQFDYVRFPTEGNQKDAAFAFQKSQPQGKRSDVITDFVRRAHQQVRAAGVPLSLDVFGVVAWQRSVDIASTGQLIPELAKHCDFLSPMIYPSHFFGMDGYAVPGDAPQHFITNSMERMVKITAGSGVVLRPWLQAFAWKTPSYSPEYIRVQVKASNSNGGLGYLFWNARNDYAKPLAALPSLLAEAREAGRTATKPASAAAASPPTAKSSAP